MKRLLLWLLLAGMALTACSGETIDLERGESTSQAPERMEDPQPAPTLDDEAVQELARRYLSPVADSGMLREDWDSPEEIDPELFVIYHYLSLAYSVGQEGITDPIVEFPAEELEAAVQHAFSVSREHLRRAGSYDPQKGIYAYRQGAGVYRSYQVEEVSREGGLLAISFVRRHSPEPIQVIQRGTLTVELDGEAARYRSSSSEHFPGPANPLTEPLDLTDLEKLAAQLVDVPASCWLLLDAWSSPEEIVPDHLLEFYKRYQFSLPEEEREMDALVMPAQPVEEFLQRFFQVSSAHLRSGEYYEEELGCYVLPEGISGSSCRVTAVTRSGDALSLDYLLYQNMQLEDLVTRTGRLELRLEGDGDGYRYLSHTPLEGETLGSRMLHPSAIGTQWTADGIAMETHGGTTQHGEPGDDYYAVYDGADLDDIAAYYLGQLEELGVTGAEDRDSVPDGWSWRGQTPNGTPLAIEIVPGGEDAPYAIAVNSEAILALRRDPA